MNYNKKPKALGLFDCKVEEFFSYTYLPIKLADETNLLVEPRLKVFDEIIGRAACDYVGIRGLDSYVSSYVYVTAKNAVQRDGKGYNRTGWHSDGFGTEDVSYIFSTAQPTIFNSSDFVLSEDDQLSMVEMEEQAKPENDYSYPNNTLLRLDQFSIHKVGQFIEGPRAFLKICFSLDKYNLKGNSINYSLDYKWDYVERKKERNIPQA